MKKYRIASVMLILMILTVCTVPSVYSAEKGTVYSEMITSVKKDDSISIPIKIKNADALMGFKLSFTPSGDELHVNDVESGDLTENGFLNHNADINEGAFEIVWSGTEAIGKDGTICILKAECVDDFKAFSFDVSYSQADTFDESFDDIELLCETVVLEGILIEESSDFEDIANEIVSDENKESVSDSVNTTLEKLGCKTPDDVTEENVEEFIEEISDSVSGFSTATENLSVDEKLDVVKELYKITNEQATTSAKSEPTVDTLDTKEPKDYTVLIVMSLSVAFAVVLVVVLLIIRRKKNEKSNS